MECDYKAIIDDNINKTNSYDGIKQDQAVIDSNGYNHVPLENLKTHYKKFQVEGPLFLQMFQRSPLKQFSTQHSQTDGNMKLGRPSSSVNRTYNPLMGSNAIHYLSQKLQQCAISDVAVMRIKSMFPTVNESHIKALLHKYHYREAVVISALQVEKHPLTTPGPHSSPIAAAAHLSSRMCTSFTSTPNRYISVSPLYGLSPKTVRSSPKMKLRYLKSIFPVVDDTILIDALSNSKNNVNTAAESLMKNGYDKLNNNPLLSKKTPQDVKTIINDDKKPQQIIIPLHEPKKTEINKKEIEKKFIEKYEKIEKEIVKLALESAEYNEKRAEHLLLSCEPKYSKIKIKTDEIDCIDASGSTRICDCYSSHTTSPLYATAPSFPTPVQDIVPKIQNIAKIQKERTFLDRSTIAYETQIQEFEFKEDIKLRNENGIKGTKSKGPNKNLLGQRCTANGPKSDLPKGPKNDNLKGAAKGLAKGSIYKSYERKKRNQSDKCSIS